MMMLDTSLQDYERETKLHDWIIRKSKSPVCETEPYTPQKRPKEINKLGPITWTVSDISKAGCLLSTPPQNVTFEDEQEMRRVYTLIYDVFRYKQVLMEALNDVLFFQMFPNLSQSAAHVWLLFYDLYHRRFKKRDTAVAPVAAKLFEAVGLTLSETALWTQRVKLAASVARLRIKHNALALSELLPQHLKDERATEKARNNPVTCWVNSVKVQDANWLIREIEKTFGLKMVDDVERLDEMSFKWDGHCPQIFCFHASMRAKLARSNFIKNHMLIVQDKSFCLGAATFQKVVSDLELTGSVIQTHVNSPRTTAYLATLLTHNEKIKRLLAFSAGTRKSEYESYFSDLGMKNVRIFSDRLIDLPQDAQYMEEVVAVFATPPNSYSAVTDPIDLVCSRGGDLSMLEALTESEETKEGKERVANILSEQKKTLRFAMSRPQIQFVLYETHSELSAENDGMVSKTLKDVNKLAKLQHAGLQGKMPFQSQVHEDQIIIDIREVNNNERLQRTEGESGDRKINAPVDISKPVIDTEEDQFLDSIEVPDTDIFHIPSLPSLCPSENTCDSFKNEGCFLALLQRKEVIRLDDKYMIQMAEHRGLFGSTNAAAVSKTKANRAAKKKEKVERKPRSRKKLKETEVSENLTQTSSSMFDIISFLSGSSTQLSIDDDEMPMEDSFFGKETKSPDRQKRDSGQLNVILPTPTQSQNRTRNILSSFTSAHIRQFVSPFYRQQEVPESKVYSPKRSSLRTSGLSSQKSVRLSLASSQGSKTKPGKKKSSKLSTDSTGSKLSLSLKKKKLSKKMEKRMVERLITPTQSMLVRTLVLQPLEINKEKSGYDYTKRIFLCQRCQKRNENI